MMRTASSSFFLASKNNKEVFCFLLFRLQRQTSFLSFFLRSPLRQSDFGRWSCHPAASSSSSSSSSNSISPSSSHTWNLVVLPSVERAYVFESVDPTGEEKRQQEGSQVTCKLKKTRAFFFSCSVCGCCCCCYCCCCFCSFCCCSCCSSCCCFFSCCCCCCC